MKTITTILISYIVFFTSIFCIALISPIFAFSMSYTFRVELNGLYIKTEQRVIMWALKLRGDDDIQTNVLF